LGVPLLVEGKPIGYIEMWESRHKREFSREEIELSQAIARQVARTIHNAQLHEALRQSEKRFRTLVERMGEGLVQMDNERVIQFVNDRFCEMLEYSRDEMLGKTGMDIILEKNGAHLTAESNDWNLGQDELQLRKKSGEPLWVQVSRAPVTNVEGEIVGSVEIHTDITKRKHAETELAKARDKALEANRLKSEMLAKVSHDLRTPLTAIVGFAEMIESGIYGDLSDKQREVLLQIIESSEDLSDLVTELLDQAQLEAGTLKLKITPFSIEDVVRRVHSVMNVLAESNGLDLDYEISSDVPQTLSGDPQRLQQILTNLVGNAIKFTAQGSIQICAFRPDESHWAVQVSDSGSGIPPEAQSYIFQAFRQVDSSPTREYTGTGLGLSIVHQLTTLMGGEVRIDSEVGKGSRFTVVLPLELKQEKIS